MSFDPNTLEPQIRQILSAPGIDLNTISAKRVRKQLPDLVPGLTAEFLREHKGDVDAVIARVFDEVSTQVRERRERVMGDWTTAEDMDGDDAAVLDAGEREDDELGGEEFTRKRTSEEMDEDEGGEDADDDDDDDNDDDEDDDDGMAMPLPKKAKKAREMSDAELARRLSSEINGRTRRNAGPKTRASAGGSAKRARKLKSAAMVDTDEEDGEGGGDDSDTGSGKKKTKTKMKSGGGRAKGGFAKEYALSEPLAAVLNIDKLSRPQVVKHLWIYIKGNELQNPRNKREIICNGAFKAIFKVDKIDMFQMNRVLGQHLHESEG